MAGDERRVVVLGAGPAGVAAALAASEAGVPVVLVDADERPGGQYHRQAAAAFRVSRPGALHHGWRAAAPRLRRLEQPGGVEVRTGTSVWGVERRDDGARLATTGAHEGHLDAAALVVATGAVERVLPFPGWDLPGVLTAGAAQALLKSQAIRPGHRVVVAGAGPLLLPVASALARTGTQVAGVCDGLSPTRWLRVGPGVLDPAKAAEAAGYLTHLATHRVPYRPGTAVVRADGDGRVEQVTCARVDADWRVVPGSEHTLAVDAVCVSHGFAPIVDVAVGLGCRLLGTSPPAVAVDRLQRTDVPGVLAAGEVTGVGGAAAATAEGAVAGLAAARMLGAEVDPARLRRRVRRRDREQRFAAALARATRLPDGWASWLDDTTLVCRCEEVAYGRVRHAVTELGAGDLRSVRMTTRCGMGYCQARVCGPIVADLVRQLSGHDVPDPAGLSRRPVLAPVPLGRL